MILQCSQCQARFLVPDQAIGPAGRNVRCAKCQHTWFQEPPGGVVAPPANALDKMLGDINEGKAPPPEPEPLPVLKPIPRGSNVPVKKRVQASMGLKIATGVAFVAAVLLAILVTMPELLLLPRSTGLELVDVGVVKLMENKQASFQINGEIYNPTAKAMHSPVLRVTLVDGEGSALQYWDFSGDGQVIEPGKALPFDTGNLEVHFLRGVRFVVEIGSPLELSLRRKPKNPDAAGA